MAFNKTILITGGTGFLGSSLVGELIEEFNIVLLLRPSSITFRIDKFLDRLKIYYNTDNVTLDNIFADNKIDIIVHCATDYGRKEVNLLSLLEANLILPLKLLELGRKNGVNCFINTDTLLDKRISEYSLSKNQFKDWLKFYSKQLLCINIALEHFYGPNDDPSKFVSYIVSNMINNIDEIKLTKGEQKRDFIYIEDVVNAFILIIKNMNTLKNGFLNFEIGANDPIKIKDFVLLVKRLTGNSCTKLNFGALPYRENEVVEISADISEIKKLGWSPSVSLEEGLNKTIMAIKESEKT